MCISGTADVLEQRGVVDVADISLVESQMAGETGSEETRAGSLFGRLTLCANEPTVVTLTDWAPYLLLRFNRQ
jgi:hypothetical protein